VACDGTHPFNQAIQRSSLAPTHDPLMADVDRSAQDELFSAYEQRTKQLYDTRGALAEAVASLTAEVRDLRGDLERVRADNQRVRADNQRVRADNQALRENAHGLTDSLQHSHEHAAQLQAELNASEAAAAALANLKIVRWTAPVRRAVYRLRSQRG
jgi:chromosome segregation ATPase